MTVVINHETTIQYRAGGHVPKFKYRGNVILATDPGKTNMAVTIGTPDGTILTILQFRAPGFENNNSDYCHDFKAFLTEYLKDCHVETLAIEAAISKQGMNFHRSSFVLTEIRANLIDLAYQLTGKKAYEINNWSWKYAILPDGMRGQHEKGSARFLPGLFDLYGNADVTDSVCIYKYAIQKIGNPYYLISPEEVEEPMHEYRTLLVPAGGGLTKNASKFLYNPKLTLKANLDYATNRTSANVYAQVDPANLTLEEIYGSAAMFKSLMDAQRMEVVALRSSKSGPF